MLLEKPDSVIVVLIEHVHGPAGVPPVADAVELPHLLGVECPEPPQPSPQINHGIYYHKQHTSIQPQVLHDFRMLHSQIPLMVELSAASFEPYHSSETILDQSVALLPPGGLAPVEVDPDVEDPQHEDEDGGDPVDYIRCRCRS